MNVEVIGVRHFSPACARWVAQRIRAVHPSWVLIEGPSDFNARIGELALPHRLPIALYSYAVDAQSTRHCYSPFIEFAPEWAALESARDVGAEIRFIDLPFYAPAWHEHTLRYDVSAHRGRDRYARTMRAVAAQVGLDGDDAVWDHLFEQTGDASDLGERLSFWFENLRGDEAGEHEDVEREQFMARYVAWAAAQGGSVIVVCGGWHQPALQRLWPSLSVDAEPFIQPDPELERVGTFLVPYSDRQLDSLSGYGAGMPSPQYYRWLWQSDGRTAADRAWRDVVRRLRKKQQVVSTASLISAEVRCEGLARLRGHAHPTRCDVLDGLLDAVVDTALDVPPPWTRRDRLRPSDAPQLREMLLALTGETQGVLASDTPLPPLVADVEALLQKLELRPGIDEAERHLDRRVASDSERAIVLWRLRELGLKPFELVGIQSGAAARSLAADFRPIEHWRIRPHQGFSADLIRAGAYGPDLASASERKLVERLHADIPAEALADGVVDAVRAGYGSLGQQMLERLEAAVSTVADHGSLARVGLRLHALRDQGFWGEDLGAALAPLLDVIHDRLLWMIEGLVGATARAHPGDVQALQFIERRLQTLDNSDATLVDATLALVARRGADAMAPPALRGACLGVSWIHGADAGQTEARIAATARALPKPNLLGDFLVGLFALARHEVARSKELVRALDVLMCGFTDDEFLIAVPALRQAFAWFPPRERGEIAVVVAALHGRSAAASRELTARTASTADLTRAAALQKAVDEVMKRYGLQQEDPEA